ncbi:hypothetical protein EJ02DRAFT_456305 [Clathrospora elynae]|uniref:Uncharacterized protein n=1 Tax=Clathrospora elynae TaxID=706981 RepID=A0A6A5SL21_9PLEO|nr:hypothetical protein EJ02DRAFT_456305 [Clathrospora elynae]
MAQGAVKKTKGAAPRKASRTGPKPGARVIKPKKTSIITSNKIKHQSSSGLIGQTEKLLAQKAGHLEMLKGGKGDKKDKRDGGGKKGDTMK